MKKSWFYKLFKIGKVPKDIMQNLNENEIVFFRGRN